MIVCMACCLVCAGDGSLGPRGAALDVDVDEGDERERRAARRKAHTASAARLSARQACEYERA